MMFPKEFEDFKSQLKIGQKIYKIGIDKTDNIFDTITIQKIKIGLIEERQYGLYCVDTNNNIVNFGYLNIKEAEARANELMAQSRGIFKFSKIKYINCDEENEEIKRKEKNESEEYNLFAFL